jgi:hypothetical protein
MQPVSSGFTGPSVVEVIYSVTSVCTSWLNV